MAVMATQQLRITKVLFITIVTLVGCNGNPLLCHLSDNPSSFELERYRLCVKARIQENGLPQTDPPSVELELIDTQHGISKEIHPVDHYLDYLDNRELHTFPACKGLPVDECRKLLNILEDITERLEGLDDGFKSAGPVRRKRSLYYPLIHLLRYIKRTGGKSDTQNLLMMYHNWRAENGYGQARGRWGRSVRKVAGISQEVLDNSREISRKTVKKLAKSLNHVTRQRKQKAKKMQPRTRRSAYAGADLGDDVFSILEQYKQWREEHGYGKFTGRWGR